MVRLFAAPSASVAVAVIGVIAVPSVPFAVPGAVIAGCWFGPPTLIVSVLLLLRGGEPLSVAVTVAPYVPESENPGARWMLPVVALVVVTVMNVGPEAFVNVRAFPSGSVPVIT